MKVKTAYNRIQPAQKKVKSKKDKTNILYNFYTPLILIAIVVAVLFLAACETPGDGSNNIAKYSFVGFNKACDEPANGAVNFNPVLGYFKTLSLDGTQWPVPFVMFKQHNPDGTAAEYIDTCE